MVLMPVARVAGSGRDQVHDSHNFGVGERTERVRGAGSRRRVRHIRVEADLIPIPSRQSDVLVKEMDEIASPQTVKEAFRVAPAGGDGAGAVRQHVYGVKLNERNNRTAEISQVAGIADDPAIVAFPIFPAPAFEADDGLAA